VDYVVEFVVSTLKESPLQIDAAAGKLEERTTPKYEEQILV
jgi:hypothetical protein